MFYVTMKGPVAMIMEVALSPTPVLKRAGVKERGTLVSYWDWATWDNDRPRQRGLCIRCVMGFLTGLGVGRLSDIRLVYPDDDLY